MRVVLSVLLCLVFAGCRSIDRLVRNSPLTGVAIDDDRVNLWPLFYASGGRFAVLWPVFDQDEEGFALRPLITKDGTQWELLPPLCWFDTKTGDWVFLPGWSVDESHGVFPLYATSDGLNHVGPLMWRYDGEGEFAGYGVIPLFIVSPGFNHVGPAYWHLSADGSVSSYGLFPLFGVGEFHSNIGPVLWGRDSDGLMLYMVGFPFFGYGRSAAGDSTLITVLGGRGWDKDGNTNFLNVLGPVYHYSREGESETTGVLLPLFFKTNGPRRDSWALWPLVGRLVLKDKEGKPTRVETSALSGLFKHGGLESTESLRFLPLFSYRSEDGGAESFVDYFSLFGYKAYKNGGTGVHLGTPIVFSYRSNEKGYRWNGLLGTLHYETEGDKSEFNFLYYLYRQRTEGTETRRDLFPFISWDSGEKNSGFSFLWRLIHWQRRGDKVGGHFLFIPWGDL